MSKYCVLLTLAALVKGGCDVVVDREVIERRGSAPAEDLAWPEGLASGTGRASLRLGRTGAGDRSVPQRRVILRSAQRVKFHELPLRKYRGFESPGV
mmetsp:Transcript_2436/g.6043  ORF Transcript_2436/g.6043 Transcript_2436/m.6043 type:complete len:97 (+) Transcript_2436:663-953(+)